MSIGDYAIGIDEKPAASRQRFTVTVESLNGDSGGLNPPHELRQVILRRMRVKYVRQKKTTEDRKQEQQPASPLVPKS
jgi:hypothetical protein